MDVLPSLARAGLARSFDPAVWPEGTVMAGEDLLIAGVPAARAGADRSARRPVAVVRVVRLVRSGPVVLCEVDGALTAHAVLADAAWPGAHLAGDRRRQRLRLTSERRVRWRFLFRVSDGVISHSTARAATGCGAAW